MKKGLTNVDGEVDDFCARRGQAGLRSLLTLVFASLLLICLLTPEVKAETYPSRPISIVVPLATGGAVDAIARLIQPDLERVLGQTVIVIDRPGASGVVGANFVAKSPADGYVLLIAPSTFTVNPAVNSKLPFDVQRDFKPIAVLVQNSMLLVVNPKLPVHNIADLVKLAKKSPGKITYSTPGAFSQAHLLIEAWSAKAGIKLQQVPFRGAAPAVLSTITGVTQMTMASPLAVLSQVKSGSLRAIATASSARDAQLPNVQTTAEAGFPDLVANQWIGLLTTGGTPPEIVKKLNDAVNVALKDKKVRAVLAAQGVETVGGTPEQFERLIASDLSMWKSIARAMHIHEQ